MGYVEKGIGRALEIWHWMFVINGKIVPATHCVKLTENGPCEHHDYTEKLARWMESQGYVQNWRTLMECKGKMHRICCFMVDHHFGGDAMKCTVLGNKSYASMFTHLRSHWKTRPDYQKFLFQASFMDYYLVQNGRPSSQLRVGMSNSPGHVPPVSDISTHEEESAHILQNIIDTENVTSNIQLNTTVDDYTITDLANELRNQDKIDSLYEADEDADFMDIDETRQDLNFKLSNMDAFEHNHNKASMQRTGTFIPFYNNSNTVNGMFHRQIMRGDPNAVKKSYARPVIETR